MKKYLLFITIVLILLFCVSSMTYEQQTIVPTLQNWFDDDRPFEEFLSKFKFTYWGRTISVETSGYFYFVEFLVRKGLHFFGYGVISILFLFLFRKLKCPFPILFSIGTTFIVASLDEFRQTFVDGRTGIFDDVLLDTAGAVTLITLLKIYETLKFTWQRKIKKTL